LATGPLAPVAAPATKVHAARRPGRRLALAAVAMSLVSSGICLIVAARFLPPHVSLIAELMTWDAWWYQTIAVHGYSWNVHSAAQQNPAFFPLYPLVELVGHIVTRLSVPYVAAASSVCFQAAAAAVLVGIVRRDGGTDRSAIFWTALFVVSPPVVFDIMGYYSALFCLLFFLAIYLCQQDRPWPAAVMVGLSGATNPIGIALAAAFVAWLVITAVSRRSLGGRSIAVLAGQALLGASGFLGYCLYLWVRFADPIAFYQANAAWSTPLPLASELRSLVTLSPVRASVLGWATSPYGEQSFTFFIDCLAFAVVVAFIVVLLVSRSGARSFGFWSLVLGLVFVQVACARVGQEASTTRFLLPVVFGAGAISPARRVLTRPLVFAVVLLVLGACTVFFLQRLAVDQWID
jgi:hypothetical protein